MQTYAMIMMENVVEQNPYFIISFVYKGQNRQTLIYTLRN